MAEHQNLEHSPIRNDDTIEESNIISPVKLPAQQQSFVQNIVRQSPIVSPTLPPTIPIDYTGITFDPNIIDLTLDNDIAVESNWVELTSVSSQRTTVLNRGTIGDPTSQNVKTFKISNVPPCTDTRQHVPVPHTTGSLQTISTASFTTGQLPVSLPQTPQRSVELLHISNRINLVFQNRLPPSPILSIYGRNLQELHLSWTMILDNTIAQIKGYQIFSNQEIISNAWKLIGYVDAIALPILCSLSYLIIGKIYHFAVRAVDNFGRFGPFSQPKAVLWN